MNRSFSHSPPDTGLEGMGLVAARAGWALVALLALMVSVVGFRSLATLEMTGILSARGLVTVPAEVLGALESLGLPGPALLRFFLGFRILGMVVFSVTALVIFMLKSDDRMTLLVSAMLLALGTALFAPLEAAVRANPGMERVVALVGVGGPPWGAFFASLAGMGLLLGTYLIPDGRFIPAWSRWLVAAAALVAGLSWLLPGSPLAVTGWPSPLQSIWVIGLLASGVGAQFYRFVAVSDDEQRRKTRLVVFALAGAVSALVLLTVFNPELGGGLFDLGVVTPEVAAVYELLLLVVLGAALLLFPLSIAVSVWRYRLWDVDLIINRALVYGLLTGLIVVMGLTAVVVLSQILGALLGEVVAAEVALVGSTVLLTLLFQPARRRVQAVVDRAFYRRKYDAARTVERFSAQLRHQVELDELASDLVAVVHQTVQPRHVSLWLRADGRAGRTEAARSTAQTDQA